jgi:uncharacterized membrane protein YphA (DoxX/SURF4 family)
MSRVLWILQVLLACVFVFSGSFKLMLPLEVVQQQLPLPGAFIRFIGSVEVLGAIGLILPALLRIRPSLTPLAAAGLVILMTGATVLTPGLTGGEYAAAVLPLILGVLAAVVAYGRWRVAPIGESRRLLVATR